MENIGIRKLFGDGTSADAVLDIETKPESEIRLRSVQLDVEIRTEGASLYRALQALQVELEARGLLLGCAGCRLDVFPTALLEDATGGRDAYVLSTQRASNAEPLDVIDIFEEAGKDVLRPLRSRPFIGAISSWASRDRAFARADLCIVAHDDPSVS